MKNLNVVYSWCFLVIKTKALEIYIYIYVYNQIVVPTYYIIETHKKVYFKAPYSIVLKVFVVLMLNEMRSVLGSLNC